MPTSSYRRCVVLPPERVDADHTLRDNLASLFEEPLDLILWEWTLTEGRIVGIVSAKN